VYKKKNNEKCPNKAVDSTTKYAEETTATGETVRRNV